MSKDNWEAAGGNVLNLVGKVLVKSESSSIMRSAIVKRVNIINFAGSISSAKSFAEIIYDNGLSEWVSCSSVEKAIQKTIKEKRIER